MDSNVRFPSPPMARFPHTRQMMLGIPKQEETVKSPRKQEKVPSNGFLSGPSNTANHFMHEPRMPSSDSREEIKNPVEYHKPAHNNASVL